MNLSQNVMTYGMDLAGLFPKYVSMKRGAMGVVIVCMAIQPWRFVAQAAIFVTILSCFTSRLPIIHHLSAEVER